jgi:F-type H+-transporting ATPase subunit a
MNVPIIAEPIAQLGPLVITNAYVNSTIVTVLFVLLAWTVKTTVKKVPGRFQGMMELLLETLLGYFDRVTGKRELSKKFLPLIGSLFLFILVSNWFGLLPGTGSIGRWMMHEGEIEFIPILRPAMSDLNLTLAMALVSVIVSHVVGMFTLGFFTHWNKFIQVGTVWSAIKTAQPVKILVALVEFVVGFIELFAEAAKVISLSLRLFGNIFAGEVLITVISSLISVAVPLPFMLMELIVGLVQATVFAMLSLVYLTLMTKAHGHDEKHATEHEPHMVSEHAPSA